MRLVAQVYITVPSNVVRRDPTFLEKVKRSLGGSLNLDTEEVSNQLEATAVVDSVRRALAKLDVGNALSLVIDDTVIFQDSDGKADDLPDLVLALSEHASVFGRGFRELRFAAEHEEAGLHLVIETRARTRHRREEPAAAVSIGGRIRSLEAQKGESADAYRARVEPLTKDPGLFETARLSFESFVARLTNALRAALPEATIDEKAPEARLVKVPERALDAPDGSPKQLVHPGYDPFAIYYPSPVGMMLDVMLFSSFMHMMMPPPILVVSPGGATLGSMSDVQADPGLASDHNVSAHDHGGGHDADQSSDAGDHDAGDAGDHDGGGYDDGGGDLASNDDVGGGGWDDVGGGWDFGDD